MKCSLGYIFLPLMKSNTKPPRLTGNIQTVFKTPEKEKNYVMSFNGRIDLMRKLWKQSKTGCNKFMVFFDKQK